jgi:hypothetical protein
MKEERAHVVSESPVRAACNAGGTSMPEHQIALLIELFRKAYDAGRVTYRPCDETRKTLNMLGFIPSDMYEVIAKLSVRDALNDPWSNRNPKYPQETVCDFGILIEGREVYIKITVVGLQDGARSAVVSFHFAKRRLEHPFK